MTSLQNDKKRLVSLLGKLDVAQRRTLVDFAEFLSGKSEPEPVAEITTPVIQPRPEKESVVKGIRRLSESYPMLEKSILFNETSKYMSMHVMQGVSAKEIIDQLEKFFAEQYQLYLSENQE